MVTGSKLGHKFPQGCILGITWQSPIAAHPLSSVLAVPAGAMSLPGPCVCLSAHAQCHPICVSLCVRTMTLHLQPHLPAWTRSMSMFPCMSLRASPYVHSATTSVPKCLLSVCLSECWVCICVSLCARTRVLVPCTSVCLCMSVIPTCPFSVPRCSRHAVSLPAPVPSILTPPCPRRASLWGGTGPSNALSPTPFA